MAREMYFLVESICTATERNQNFAGEMRYYLHGKKDECLLADGDERGWYNFNNLSAYHVREYGYKRKCDAARCYSYTHPQNDKHWKTETRIVRAWVRKDGKVSIC